MLALLQVILLILGLFKWILIISAVLSWLMAFGVINSSNQFVAQVYQITSQLTEPFLRPIRRHLPRFNGLDLSFLALYFGVILIELFIQIYLIPGARAAGI